MIALAYGTDACTARLCHEIGLSVDGCKPVWTGDASKECRSHPFQMNWPLEAIPFFSTSCAFVSRNLSSGSAHELERKDANLQVGDERRQMGSGFSRKFCPSAQDSWQFLTFEGQTCSLRGSGSLLVMLIACYICIDG